MTNPTNLTEKDILQDCLSSQKHATATFNTCAGECANTQLRDAMLNILTDEHKIQSDIFNHMHANGWYPTEQAEQNKIQAAKQKYCG